MSRWEKLIKRLYSIPNDMSFDELCKILESYGYVKSNPHGGSSHYTFRKQGKPSITIPKHGRIREIYVKMVCDVVTEEEKNHE